MLSKRIMCHFWFRHILSNYYSEVCWIYTPTKSMFRICFLTCSPTLDIINLYFKGKAGGKMQHPNFSLSFAFWINLRISCILLIYICISLSGKFSFTLFTHFPLGLWFVKCLRIWALNYGNQPLVINFVIICFMFFLTISYFHFYLITFTKVLFMAL